MFFLIVFVLLFAVFSLLFFLGTAFIQSYTATQPTDGLAWRAPAAAGAMALFFTLWTVIVARGDSEPGNIPYDTFFRFSPKVSLSPDPATKMWAVRQGGKRTEYIRAKDDIGQWTYHDDRKKPWPSTDDVIAIEITHAGTKMHFDRIKSDDGYSNSYTSDQGWTMRAFSGGAPNGIPERFVWTRFLGVLLLNILHAAAWFACLWLLVQFRFNEALLFAFILWVAMTVVIVPMLLDEAAYVARARTTATQVLPERS